MTSKTNILLTGATGFVGRALLGRLIQSEAFNVTAALRRDWSSSRCSSYVVGDISASTNWGAALHNQQVVIHAAARVHVLKDEVADPLAEYRSVNVDATLNLARQALIAGVERFIYISSIKVNGEQTPLGRPFTSDDIPDPQDDYAISKWEAEQGLKRIAEQTGMELVILRPPLVYGPGVKGNLERLVKLIKSKAPLPFGSIGNQRTFIALDNLVDLIITCISHPSASNQVFLAGDADDLSTKDLILGLSQAMGKSRRLIPISPLILSFILRLVGKDELALRLLGSLQVDKLKVSNVLGWRPVVSVNEGLKKCFEQESP